MENNKKIKGKIIEYILQAPQHNKEIKDWIDNGFCKEQKQQVKHFDYSEDMLTIITPL